MRTYAIANQKGGVGKTSITYFLALELAAMGFRILLVDADPQGSLTKLTVDDIDRDDAGLADVLSAATDTRAADVLTAAKVPGITVLPTPDSRRLSRVRDELVLAGPGREHRLAEALESSITDDFDICLIDCPPSLDLLTINALTAALEVLIVTQARVLAADGLAELLDTVDAVRQYSNPKLSTAGILINLFERSQVGQRSVLAEIEEYAAHAGIPVFDPPIGKYAVLADAAEAGTDLAAWRGSAGRALIDRLTNEFQAHANQLIGEQK